MFKICVAIIIQVSTNTIHYRLKQAKYALADIIIILRLLQY